MRIDDGDCVVGMDIVRDECELLVISEHGYGKRTPLSEYHVQARAGKGVMTLKVSDKTGPVTSALVVRGNEDLMVISREGTLIRTSVSDISVLSRATQGVKVMRLEDGDAVIDTARFVDDDEE